MYLNLGLLRIEILILLISLIYATYYFVGNIFFSFLNLKSILGKKKRNIEPEGPKELKIKTDENEHAENYTKDDLSYEQKLEINELLKKARVFIGSGEYDKAKNYLVEGLSIDKFNFDLNLDLAKIYIIEKDFLKAEYIYKDLLIVHSEDITVMKKLGDLLTNQEKYELSLEIYKKAYKIDKNDLEIINMLANLSYVTQDFIRAEIYLKEFLKEKPKDLDNLLLLGNTYEKLEDYEDAVKAYEKALIMKPYDNFEIKDKIHKLEIFLLEGKNDNIEVTPLKEEVEEYKEEKTLEDNSKQEIIKDKELEEQEISEENLLKEKKELEEKIKKLEQKLNKN